MTLKRDLTRFVQDTGDKTFPAVLGRKSGGAWELHIPGQLGWVWITTGGASGFGGGFEAARGYKGGTPGMPIRYKIRNGIAEIVGADTEQIPIYTGGGTTIIEGTSAHTHGFGSGNLDMIDGRRFLPGAVHPYKTAGSFGLSVWIEPFFYKRAGQLIYFAGQAVDLTSYVPGTASKKAWVVVGVDPADNTATAVTGTEYALAVNMAPSLLHQFAFGGFIPLGAVVLQNGQTSIDNIKQFSDTRNYVDPAGDQVVNAIGSIGGGTQDIDLNLGPVVSATVDTSATTFTFSNPPASGLTGHLTIVLTNGGSQTVNWPGSVQWAGGSAPSLTASGVDVLRFMTLDGGTIWYGELVGANYS